MKTKDIAAKYRLDQNSFDRWVTSTRGIVYKSSLTGSISIEGETEVEAAVAAFQTYSAEREEQLANKKAETDRAAAEAAQAEQNKQQALASILITSGFSFDGFKISKYSGYISGDDVIQINRGSQGIFSSVTDVGEALMSSLTTLRRNALAELKEAAYNLGCNAVIGVDFDYMNFAPETVSAGGGTLYLPYVFGVTANGNAVVIEKS